ncbi:sulfotransferase [Thermococcus sp. LS2]|uniref:sulfotransferase n=1 Tax=Thermococcus sp. LS2 TaxID=1638260 RepID=UPI00143A725E|nr:sulfotransferase [Thermococcus sp. LS2]NJE12880.1 hypothetical protein [Thermococcus sp. LS2]
MYLHEKIPMRLRRNSPQWVKEGYVRWILLMKKIKVNMYFWIDEDDIEEWFNTKNVFFILSIGRSGTQFLSDLLNKAPGALVVHEPFIEAIPHQEAFHNPREAEKYIQTFRKKEIYLRVHKFDIETYGEVNSFLRRHCNALKKAFPKAKLLHLVRDGRDVVRSMYSRETMKPGAYDTKRIYPKEDDPWRDEWPRMSRFEKLCWYWMIENKYLRECIGKTIQFEKVISDYNYFKKNVLKPLNLEIPREIWEETINKPKNITVRYKLPHWREWDQKKREAFERICGEEMKKCGYKLDW